MHRKVVAPITYLVREGQGQLDLVGCHVGVATAEGWSGAEGRFGSLEGAPGNSQRVHDGQCGQWGGGGIWKWLKQKLCSGSPELG